MSVQMEAEARRTTAAIQELQRTALAPLTDESLLEGVLVTAALRDRGDEFVAAAQHAAGFLVAMSNADATAYSRWLASNAYRPQEKSWLLTRGLLPAAYERATGKPLQVASDFSISSVFEEMRSVQMRNPGSQLVRVSAHPDGVGVSGGTWNPQSSKPVAQEGWFADCRPEGAAASTSVGMHRGTVSSIEMRQAGKPVLVASIALVGEFADGQRRPIWIELVQDPSTKKWFVENVSHSTFDAADATAIRFEW